MDASHPPPLELQRLPPDLLEAIFRRVPNGSSALMPVSRTFRDVYRTRARSVRICRPFRPGLDDALLDALRRSPSLASVSLPRGVQQGRDGSLLAQWPTGRLTNIKTLWVPAGWELDQIPTTLQHLHTFFPNRPGSTLPVGGARWLGGLLQRFSRAPARCRVHISCVVAAGDEDLAHLDAPCVELEVLRVTQSSLLPRAAALADRCRLRTLQVTARDGVRDLSWLRGASRLTSLQLHGCTSLASMRGFAAASLPALQELGVGRDPYRSFDAPSIPSLEGLAGASLPALTLLHIGRCTSLTSLQGLDRAALPALRELRLAHVALASLQSLDGCRLPSLKRLMLHSISSLTSFRGLEGAHMPRLIDLDVDGCAAHTLSPLQACSFPSLRRLILQRCALTGVDGLGGEGRFPFLCAIELVCTRLQGLQGLSGGSFPALQTLTVCCAKSMTSLHGLDCVRHLSSLTRLHVQGCGLTTLHPLECCDVSSLLDLDLRDNFALTRVACLPRMPNLQYLRLRGCGVSIEDVRPVLVDAGVPASVQLG